MPNLELTYKKISNRVDNWDDTEKLFALYLLMETYKDFAEKCAKATENCSDKTQTLAYFKALEHVKFANEAKEILGSEVF